MPPNTRLPTFARVMLYCQFLGSNVVLFEPAPFDILFIATLLVFVSGGYLCFHRGIKLIIVLLSVFMLLSLLSLTAVTDAPRGVEYLSITFYLILLCVFITSVRLEFMEETLHIIFSACAVSAVLFTAVSLLDFYGVMPVPDAASLVTLDYTRLKGFFKDPNVFGPTISFSLLYLFHLLNQRGNAPWRSLWSLAGVIILTAGVFLSYSRGAWVGLVLALGVYCLLMFVHRGFRLTLGQVTWQGFLLASLIIGFGVVLQNPVRAKT
ncbi:MAG: hypothetical protein KGI29_06235, partial [Pseudomonadota bacterium]|nr:hypothetical protein [Pseudomonadota bacterium]